MRALTFAALVLLAGAGAADDKDDIAKYTKDLKSKDAKVRLKATEALAELGPDASRPLCDAMLDPSLKVAKSALLGLEKTNPKLHKHLAVIALEANEERVHKAILDVGAMGKEGAPAFGFMAARFRAELVRKTPGAVYTSETATYFDTLGKIGGESEECVALFKNELKSPRLKSQAFAWLVKWAGDNRDRRKDLLPEIRSGVNQGSTRCIELAGQYGDLSKDMLPSLKKLKLSPVQEVRDAATKAIELIESP